MIDPFRRGIAWYKYKRLESDFINATSYFPFEDKHKEIWSEHFSDLITKIGNSIDSFFRIMLKEDLFNSYPHVSTLRRSRKSRDIHYFREFFEPIYQLSGARVLIGYGLAFYSRHCRPFEEFADKGVPRWWTAYNHVKHQWFDKIEEATLENTVEALAGLFVLNILHKKSKRYLIRNTNVISVPFGKTSHLKKNLLDSMIGVSNIGDYEVIAQTPLFTHVYRVERAVSIQSE